MKPLFADTFYSLAMLNRGDAGHERAVRFSADHSTRLVTTWWVLTELADGLASVKTRAAFCGLVELVREDRRTRVVPVSQATLSKAVALYASRSDKSWSLTDCTSFITMARLGLTAALTGDRHFAQAGYEAVLA